MRIYRIAKLADTLQGWGVSEDIISFVQNAPDEMRPLYMRALKLSPQTTLTELQKIKLPEKESPYTPHEIKLAEREFPDNERLRKWLLVNLRKARMAFGPVDDDYLQLFLMMRPLGKGQEISDWVEQTGADIEKMTIVEALQASDDWHSAMAGAGSGKQYGPVNQNLILYGPQWNKPEWNGWTIQKVVTKNDLLVEGNKMNHCVGSYANEVRYGRVTIVSLRDPRNNPHVTLEFDGNQIKNANQIRGNSNKEPDDEYKAMIKEWISSLGWDVSFNDMDPGLEMFNSAYSDVQEMVDSLDVIGSSDDYGMSSQEIERIDFGDLITELTKAQEKRDYRDRDYFSDITRAPYKLFDLAKRKYENDPILGLYQLEMDCYEVLQEVEGEAFTDWDYSYLYDYYEQEHPEPEQGDFATEEEYKAAHNKWEQGRMDFEADARDEEMSKYTRFRLPQDTVELIQNLRKEGKFPELKDLEEHYGTNPYMPQHSESISLVASNWYRRFVISSVVNNAFELQDILYGLKHWPELRPSSKRISALKSIENPDNNILEMIEIWESGHGVLSNPQRISSLEACFPV